MDLRQCRMARAALGWSATDLAARSGVAVRTVARFELGEKVKAETVAAMAAALVNGGALFIETHAGRGVLVKP
jgi:transcriptional regulator with XRE-family HTH domain